MSIQRVGREGAQFLNGLVLPCRSLLAASLHTLSVTYLLCYFTSHVHDAKSVAVVYDDPLMVFMPCIAWQSQNRNRIVVHLGEETCCRGTAQMTTKADPLCSVRRQMHCTLPTNPVMTRRLKPGAARAGPASSSPSLQVHPVPDSLK